MWGALTKPTFPFPNGTQTGSDAGQADVRPPGRCHPAKHV